MIKESHQYTAQLCNIEMLVEMHVHHLKVCYSFPAMEDSLSDGTEVADVQRCMLAIFCLLWKSRRIFFPPLQLITLTYDGASALHCF